MVRRAAGLLLLSAVSARASAAQAPQAGDTRMPDAASPFRQLSLPSPTQFRSGSGRPGGGYWQQRADYRIDASLDPARNELRGHEIIHYVNRSPDALPYLWMFVEQNICTPTSVTEQLDQPPLVFLGSTFDFSCKGFSGGLTLEQVRATWAGRSDAQGLRQHHATRPAPATRTGPGH